MLNRRRRNNRRSLQRIHQQPRIHKLVRKKRSVKVVVTEGLNAAVTGINPGDVMANSSFDKLQDKAKIVVSKQPIPANTSGSNAP